MEHAATGDSSPAGGAVAGVWRDVDAWAARAARLGSLHYADLGERWLRPPRHVDAVAAWLVDAVDRWWQQAGRPDPYVVSVASGDDGTLARAVLGLGPECLTALRYVIVDPEADTAAGQARARSAAGLLGLEDPAFLFPTTATPTGGDDGDEAFDPDEARPLARGVGPLVTTLSGLPVITDAARFGGEGPAGVIVAVDLLSALAYDVLSLDGNGTWSEERLAFPDAADAADAADRAGRAGAGAAGGRAPGGLITLVVALDGERVVGLPAALVQAGPGRYAHQVGAAAWLRRVLGSTPASMVAVVDGWALQGAIDPAATAGDPAPPLAFDQLRRVHEPVDAAPVELGDGVSVVTWEG